MKFKIGDIVKSYKKQRVYKVVGVSTSNCFEGKVLINPDTPKFIGDIRPVRCDVCNLISTKGHPNTNVFK